MKVWITGIAGFLGSYLAKELTALGHDVSGNDNFLCHSSPEAPIEAVHCTGYGNQYYHNKYWIDCCDFNSMQRELSLAKTDVVIHCAATAHEGLSSFSPSFITKNIYEASVSTFSAAIASGVRRIIFMSSMARYGRQSLPFHEQMTPQPVDPYGIAKVAAEDTLRVLCNTHGVEYVIAIPHNIIGAGQRYCDPYRNVASIMINRALQGKSIIVYGDGLQKRCFSPIKDCLHSLTKMIDAPIDGQTINIGPDHNEISILELASIITDLTGGTAEIQHVRGRPNEVKEAWCTSAKAKKFLGYKMQQPLRECLKEMVEHIRMHGTKEFEYSFPIEILTAMTPRTWVDRTI